MNLLTLREMMFNNNSMEFSDFGNKLSQHSGILQLMDDISRPLPPGVKAKPLGGGNPARVREAERVYREELERLLQDGDRFEDVIAHYDSPQGRVGFLRTAADFFHNEYGWDITEENIALTNGSQSAMFYLFNLFSGKTGKRVKKIFFPLMPEYIGYADQGIESGTFCSIPSKCVYYDDRTFKYTLDTDAVRKYLEEHDDIGAMAVSRPTNPSGNVLRDSEIRTLAALSHEYSIPLIIDSAAGMLEARKARGASFISHPLSSLAELSSSILSDIFDKAEIYIDALYSRGYDTSSGRYCAEYRGYDWLIIASCIVITIAWFIFREV